MLNYIKLDLFLQNSFVESENRSREEVKVKSPESGPDLSHLSLENRERVNTLRKDFETLKLSEKFVGGMEWRLRTALLKDGDPKDREYHEIAEKIKKYQWELKQYWAQWAEIQKELSQLLGEVQTEIKKLSPQEVNALKSIDNKDFLNIPPEKRLQYITKNHIDSSEVASWDTKEIDFTFSFEGQFNRELYLKTTAWQVLPKEVGNVIVWGKTYSRTNVWGEFFTLGNERLTIHEWTKIEIGALRTAQDIEQMNTINTSKVSEYLKNNTDAHPKIVSEAINRGIDPKFANIAFGDLVKNTPDEQVMIVLEDAFTEFDRYRGNFNIWNELQDRKYSETLVMGLLTQFSKDWKQSAKDYWISPERIKAAETNGEVYYWMDALAIQNADSMPDGTYLKWEQLLQNPQFSAKLDKVCASLWANREDLIKVMKAESRLDPRIVNKQSWATWLIQFMPRTAAWLGTSVGNIRAMTWVEQLDLVEKYFKQNSRGYNLSTIEDLYKVVFFPLSLWKSNDWVFDAKDAPAHKVASQNPWISKFSQRSDGLIDGHTFSKYVNNHVSRLA